MEFKKVAILGAGAVGSYVIWGLSEKKDIALCVVADGARKERLAKEGLMINDRLYKPEVLTPEEAHGADLLIVTLKYGALRATLQDIRTVADDHTTIISLMNGIDSEEIISEVVPKEQIVYSLIKVASERKNNSIHFDPVTTIGIIYGEPAASSDLKQTGEISSATSHITEENTMPSANPYKTTNINSTTGRARMEALDRLFSGTGLHYRESSEIMVEMWGKFLLNVGNNLPQAMIGCGVGAYRDSEHVNFLRLKLREEVIEIATAKGIDLSKSKENQAFGSKVRAAARYSTLQDLDAHRHTEIEMFSGAVVRMGHALGIPTPYNEFTLHMIHALEEKNDGKFDYE